MATGTAPLTYQWRRNGVALAGATSASYALTNAGLEIVGVYEVVITNPVGSVISAPASITLNSAVTLLTQPASTKVNPGKVNMSSAGVGSQSHLSGALLLAMGGFDSVHVPHKGGGPSVASVIAGQTHFTFAPAPAAMSQVKAGRLRAIAHSLPSRSKMLGDMPAVNETLPGYDYSTWAGLLAPKGLPKPIQDRLLGALQKTLQIPAVLEGLTAQGAEVLLIQGEDYRKYIAQDLIATAKFVQAAGLQAE